MTDKELMALMLYGECRGETQFGKLCAASTVMNRLILANTKGIVWWGTTVSEIIQSPMQYQGFANRDPSELENDLSFKECKQVAIAVLDFDIVVPNITHFAGDNIDLEKLLKLKYCFEVGNHRFYQEEF